MLFNVVVVGSLWQKPVVCTISMVVLFPYTRGKCDIIASEGYGQTDVWEDTFSSTGHRHLVSPLICIRAQLIKVNQ